MLNIKGLSRQIRLRNVKLNVKLNNNTFLFFIKNKNLIILDFYVFSSLIY